MKKIPFIVLIWFVMAASCGVSWAAGLDNMDLPNRQGFKIGVGKVRLHGAFKAAEQFETNIFQADSGAKFDAISVINPSVGIEIPFYDHMLSADYDAAMFMYGKYKNENHLDQRIRGLLELNFTDYKPQVKDTYRDFTDRAADENSRRIQRKINDFTTDVGAQFGKLGFKAGYNNVLEIYGSPDDLVYRNITYRQHDSMTNMVFGNVSYLFWPKTALFFESDLGFVDFYNSRAVPGSYFIDAVVGIKGKPSNKITADFKAGFRLQDYNSSNVMSDKGYIGPVAKGGFEFAINNKSVVTFMLERSIIASTYDNESYYTLNLVGLKYLYRLNKKISFSSQGSYVLDLYPTATTEGGVNARRYDNIYDFGVTARYDVRKWASVELNYDYTQRKSIFSTFDFIDNRVTVSGTVGF